VVPQAFDLAAISWPLVLAALARAGGFAAVAPTVGLATESARHRIVLAVLITLMLLPFGPAEAASMPAIVPIGLIVHGLAMGGLLGFALRVLLSGVAMAAQLTEHQLGFALAAESDDETSGSSISRLYQMLAMALFFTLGGHRLVLASLMDAGSATDRAVNSGRDLLELAVGLITHTCWFALRIAAPVTVTLLTTSFIVGMISRVLPQSSVSTIVMPARVALGLVLILISLAAVVPSIRSELISVLGSIAAAY
jgi:flagellar biosynthetic protein FliR